MSRKLVEQVSLAEAATTSDTRSGVLEVEFITPGWGSSGYYSREVVEAAAPLFAVGTHLYLDHPTATEDAERPVRSVRDIAAVITEAGTVNPDTGGVRGKVKATAPYRELLTDETLMENIGLSIRGSATDITIGEAEGRQGPIIEGLADVQSVDFVTRAGRGGRVLQVLESARFLNEATAGDRAQQLSDAVRATYGGDNSWAWVLDQDADERTVWFEVSPASGPSKTYQQGYDVAANDVDVTLTGDPTEVRRLTQYVPVTRPGSTTANPTQESKEDTMPQIEEARLRELEEAAGRVSTLESERDTERAGREAAERALAEATARTAATTRARTRITEANGNLAAATVDRIVAAATATVPLTEAGVLDETALDTAVDTARTAEETYLASLAESAGAGTVFGLGTTSSGDQSVTESDADQAVAGAFGRTVKGA